MSNLEEARVELAILLEERAQINERVAQLSFNDDPQAAEEVTRLYGEADKSYRAILAVQNRITSLGGVVDDEE